MADDVREVTIKNLPMTQNGGLRVELIPMPSGDNPWRTRGDYEKEQRRDTVRFWITIASLIISIISVVATAAVAIVTIRSAG
jgi:hypothetical protein